MLVEFKKDNGRSEPGGAGGSAAVGKNPAEGGPTAAGQNPERETGLGEDDGPLVQRGVSQTTQEELER